MMINVFVQAETVRKLLEKQTTRKREEENVCTVYSLVGGWKEALELSIPGPSPHVELCYMQYT